MSDIDKTFFEECEVLQVGDEFGKYIVLNEIDRGGMGIVYKCQERHSKRTVAIKFLLKGAKNLIAEKRFLRETKIMGELRHPNIVTVYAAGNYNGHLYLVMEYLEGTTLDKFPIQQLSQLQRIQLIKKIALALYYTHKNGSRNGKHFA